MVLFPKGNQADWPVASSSFPLIHSGEDTGWGLLTCSDVGQPPPKAAKPPRSSQRQEARHSQAAEEAAERPGQVHSDGVKFSPVSYVKMEVSPYILTKRTQIPPRLC